MDIVESLTGKKHKALLALLDHLHMQLNRIERKLDNMTKGEGSK